MEEYEAVAHWPSAGGLDWSIRALVVFTDGSATMSDPWPKLAMHAGWAFIVFALGDDEQVAFLGGAWAAIVPGQSSAVGCNFGALRPTSPVAEVCAITAVLASLRSVGCFIPVHLGMGNLLPKLA